MTLSVEMPVEVAVGILIRPNGEFLIAQRPVGKPMAGWWEFPGGKLEAGESVFEALRRELQEELGLTITVATPWAQRVFVYPHATVRLHFMRVWAWEGEPRSLEAQAFRWERIAQLTTEPWLEGSLPLKRWLQLPATYAISNATELGQPAFLERLDAALADRRLHYLLLREPGWDDASVDALLDAVLARTRDHAVKVLVSSRHAESMWSRADGVHCTARDLQNLTRRPDVDWCAASCHDALDIARAGDLGFDFAVLGPVKQTASHAGQAGMGWDAFMGLATASTIPVYALGGISADDVPQAVRCGAQGVAMMRGFWDQ